MGAGPLDKSAGHNLQPMPTLSAKEVVKKVVVVAHHSAERMPVNLPESYKCNCFCCAHIRTLLVHFCSNVAPAKKILNCAVVLT